MKEIVLTQGKRALVDDDDFERLNKYYWCAQCISGRWYAETRVGHKLLFLHYAVLNCWPIKGNYIDHKNRNGLDNRKENLRKCTNQQNSANAGLSDNNTSGYKGVNWDKQTNKWRAKITYNYKTISIGRFHTIDEAAEAYDQAAIKYFGEFALTNSILKEAGLVA